MANSVTGIFFITGGCYFLTVVHGNLHTHFICAVLHHRFYELTVGPHNSGTPTNEQLYNLCIHHVFIHSFSSLSYDRSKASSKASSPHSAIQTFLLQMRVFCLSLRSSNSFLRLLPCLPLTSIPPCIFPSVTRCRRQFLRKM